MVEKINRRLLLGASEVSAVLGLSPYCTPLQLWSEKVGRTEPDDLSDNEAVEWGRRLERIVSDKFSEKHGVKLIAYKKRFVHPDMPYFSCELDNIIAGTDEIVEIKTVNQFSHDQWSNPDELPAHVIAQVMAQMGLSGRKKAWVACLCGGSKYIEKEVVFDEKFWESICTNVKTFWSMVKKNQEPLATGQDNKFLSTLYPESKGEIRDIVGADVDETLKIRAQTVEEIKGLEGLKDQLEAKLKQLIGNDLGVKSEAWQATWKEQDAVRVNTQALKDAGLYDKYSRVTKSRVLRVKELKC